jgi:hypothetical protein
MRPSDHMGLDMALLCCVTRQQSLFQEVNTERHHADVLPYSFFPDRVV